MNLIQPLQTSPRRKVIKNPEVHFRNPIHLTPHQFKHPQKEKTRHNTVRSRDQQSPQQIGQVSINNGRTELFCCYKTMNLSLRLSLSLVRPQTSRPRRQPLVPKHRVYDSSVERRSQRHTVPSSPEIKVPAKNGFGIELVHSESTREGASSRTRRNGLRNQLHTP